MAGASHPAVERGAALLAAGDAERARAVLAAARELAPRDTEALGLLGQALFKLGRHEEAAATYSELVDLTPGEPAARVNLGLAALKAGNLPQAIRQLEIALDLAPGHRRAMGYLGMALLEAGDPARARPWLERSGSAALMARCEASLRAAPVVPVRPVPAGEGDEVAAPPARGGAGEPVHEPRAGGAAPAPGQDAGTPTFTLRGDRLLVHVRDVVIRQEGLLSVRGSVTLSPEVKRYDGRASGRAFGLGAQRMLRARGDGELSHRVSTCRLEVLDLGPGTLYLREEVLFAFGGGVTFDNGKLGAVGGPELSLVRLAGPGRAVLALRGALARLEVAKDTPARVLAAVLVGWQGALAPLLAPLTEGSTLAETEPLAVTLRGEGRVLLDEGAAV